MTTHTATGQTGQTAHDATLDQAAVHQGDHGADSTTAAEHLHTAPQDGDK